MVSLAAVVSPSSDCEDRLRRLVALGSAGALASTFDLRLEEMDGLLAGAAWSDFFCAFCCLAYAGGDLLAFRRADAPTLLDIIFCNIFYTFISKYI